MKRAWPKWRPGLLATNTLWLTAGYGLRTLIQAVYFILIARALGAQGYGVFAGTVALATVLASFSGWGAGFLLVKNVARQLKRFAAYWGRALLLLGISGSVLVGIALALSAWLLQDRVPQSVVVAVAIADLLLAPLVAVCAQAFQAFQRLRDTALMLVLLAVCRLAAAGVMWLLVASPTAEHWAGFYVASSACAATLCVARVYRTLGGPRFAGIGARNERREGFSFSLNTAAQRAGNEMDKAMLLKLGTLEAAGTYSAAFRLVEVASMPVAALLAASYARFFQHGSHGLPASLRFARQLLAPALGYTVLAGAGIYLVAPLLPAVLGADYAEAVDAARWLAILPIPATLHALVAHALAGAGRQHICTTIEIVSAATNVLLNILWIPLYSYHGAVWAMLASRAFAAACAMCLAATLAPTSLFSRHRSSATEQP